MRDTRSTVGRGSRPESWQGTRSSRQAGDRPTSHWWMAARTAHVAGRDDPVAESGGRRTIGPIRRPIDALLGSSTRGRVGPPGRTRRGTRSNLRPWSELLGRAAARPARSRARWPGRHARPGGLRPGATPTGRHVGRSMSARWLGRRWRPRDGGLARGGSSSQGRSLNSSESQAPNRPGGGRSVTPASPSRTAARTVSLRWRRRHAHAERLRARSAHRSRRRTVLPKWTQRVPSTDSGTMGTLREHREVADAGLEGQRHALVIGQPPLPGDGEQRHPRAARPGSVGSHRAHPRRAAGTGCPDRST